ncbi:hypothetical protein [Schumannella sp. 10F1B-5-1]|uniref:hypothetical protein n=1 Tax=Schumannella sp. 10F1B-5-1 TaxID=2590780 RepID=UPI0015E87765|nr:hypothetical protein [Schumannella sp. 10F1B-5-1]
MIADSLPTDAVVPLLGTAASAVCRSSLSTRGTVGDADTASTTTVSTTTLNPGSSR